MSYTIQAIEDEKYVFLSYYGALPGWKLSATRYEADIVLEERQWHRLLVDATQLESDPTPVELYDFARSLPANTPRRTRVALLVRPEQARHAKTVEKFARTGRLFLSYFLDRDKAHAWLTEQSPRERTGFRKEMHLV